MHPPTSILPLSLYDVRTSSDTTSTHTYTSDYSPPPYLEDTRFSIDKKNMGATLSKLWKTTEPTQQMQPIFQPGESDFRSELRLRQWLWNRLINNTMLILILAGAVITIVVMVRLFKFGVVDNTMADVAAAAKAIAGRI